MALLFLLLNHSLKPIQVCVSVKCITATMIGTIGSLPLGLSIIPEYSLEGLLLKLKLQYFGHLMRRVVSLKKALMMGKY